MTLLLAELRWMSPRPWVDRLWPYVPAGWERGATPGALSVTAVSDVLAPLATSAADAVAGLLGVHDDLATRLARTHRAEDPTAIRSRQIGGALAAFALAAAITLALRPPSALAVLLLLGMPVAAFLVVEQRLTAESERWQRRIFLELPVVSEQIGMLLAAGYSLGGALDRVGSRGTGACAADVRRVRARITQGLDEAAALREWAALADVPALDRLVSTLTIDPASGDLGDLIAEEARALRSEAQRERRADLDRRAQQVWIPVTVATLVPGTMFLAVPFLDALRLFGGS
jgi:Flp pilus assembly protein TadB